MFGIKTVERKIGMSIFSKIIAGFIERTCKNYVTTIVGILSVLLYAFDQFGHLIPPQYHEAANLAAVLVMGVALLLARDAGIPKSSIPNVNKLGAILLIAALCPLALRAQTTTPAPIQNFYAGGVAWNQSATPAVAGNALYAHLVTGSNTYAFTDLDLLPTSTKPFTLTTNIGAGIAETVYTVGKYRVWIPTAAGISLNGSNTGWQWNTGAAVSIPLKNDFWVLPNVRFLKSNVSGGSGVQPIIGIDFGWGK